MREGGREERERGRREEGERERGRDREIERERECERERGEIKNMCIFKRWNEWKGKNCLKNTK